MNSTVRNSGARRGQPQGNSQGNAARDSGANSIAPVARDLRPSAGDRALRLLVDARKIEHGGIGVYTRNLVRGLLELNNLQLPHFPNIELSLLGQAKTLRSFDFYDQVSIIEENSKPYSIDELCFMGRRLARRLEASAIDIAHFPHYVLPYRLPVPAVVTVHDLIHLQRPEQRYYPMIARPLIKSALNRAKRVITVSQASRNALGQLMGEDSAALSKLRLIPNALDPFFLKRDQAGRESVQRPVLRHLFEQQTPYFFALFSTLKPHKGLDDLLSCFASIKREAQVKRLMTIHRTARSSASERVSSEGGLKLVLAGQGLGSGNSKASALTAETRALLATPELKGEVIVLGTITREELYQLYSHAEALVVPSLLEGFSLPVIEAQAVGTPVIARPVPAIMELLSEHDLVAADLTRPAFEEVLRAQLGSNRRYRQGPPADSRARLLSRFDQLEISRMLVTVYQEVLGAQAVDGSKLALHS